MDTDLGADDIVALAMLLRSPTVDVRAVTVSGTGLVHCPAGVRHVHSLLVELGAEHPVGCGRGDPGPDGLAFPAPWRASSDELMSGGQYLWDELAAIALVDPTLVRTERLRVQVDTTELNAGRVARSDSGPEIQAALSADGTRAVNAILEALRTTP